VVKDAVWENLDKLACGLVETQNPEDAWRAVFINLPEVVDPHGGGDQDQQHLLQHTRSAVMSKVCHVFTDFLG